MKFMTKNMLRRQHRPGMSKRSITIWLRKVREGFFKPWYTLSPPIKIEFGKGTPKDTGSVKAAIRVEWATTESITYLNKPNLAGMVVRF